MSIQLSLWFLARINSFFAVNGYLPFVTTPWSVIFFNKTWISSKSFACSCTRISFLRSSWRIRGFVTKLCNFPIVLTTVEKSCWLISWASSETIGGAWSVLLSSTVTAKDPSVSLRYFSGVSRMIVSSSSDISSMLISGFSHLGQLQCVERHTRGQRSNAKSSISWHDVGLKIEIKDTQNLNASSPMYSRFVWESNKSKFRATFKSTIFNPFYTISHNESLDIPTIYNYRKQKVHNITAANYCPQTY